MNKLIYNFFYKNIFVRLILAFLGSLLLAIFIPGIGPDDFYILLISISTFLFGILVAFFISDKHSRMKSIQETLRDMDAKIISIYKYSTVFGPKVHDDIKKLIDDWLTSTLDYKLVDLSKTSEQYLKIYDYVLAIKTKNDDEFYAKDRMCQLLESVSSIYKRLGFLLRDNLSYGEWFLVSILAGIIFVCLFVINTGSILSILFIVLLSVSLFGALFILRDLNSLEWKERYWIIEPLLDLFAELDMIPYFPDTFEVYLNKIKFPKGFKYRVAHYTGKYPDDTKTIEVIEK
jgi:hypothetical protein